VRRFVGIAKTAALVVLVLVLHVAIYRVTR